MSSSSSSSSSFAVNDAVYINRSSSSSSSEGGGGGESSSKQHHRLEGVITYIGKVQFATTGDNNNDWIGIRLTGSSIGQGKNDGTVKGVKYFDNCPPNCGIFVKSNLIEKRALNKLEELKLKRELNKGLGGGGGGGGSTARSPPRSSTTLASGIKTPPRTTTSGSGAVAETTASSGSKKTMSKLEELRQRRAAVNAKRQQQQQQATSAPAASAPAGTASSTSNAAAASTGSDSEGGVAVTAATAAAAAAKSSLAVDTTATTTASTATTAGSLLPTPTTTATSSTSSSSATVVLLQQKVDKLEQQLNVSQKENSALQNRLTNEQQKVKLAQEQSHQYQEKVKRLEREQAETAAAARTSSAAATVAAAVEQPASAAAEDTDDEAAREKIAELQKDLDTFQLQKKQLEQQLNDRQDELVQAQTQIHALQHQIADTSIRQETSSQYYKEKAKLQADIAGLERKLQSIENEKLDLDNTIEDLTLDKEQLEQEKEQLEDMLEEKKLDAETAMVQVEEMKMELEDAQQQIAQAAEDSAGGGIGVVGGIGGAAAGTAGTAGSTTEEQQQQQEDMAHALSVQNARLREALIRLREQSALEKLEIGRQLREAEKEAAVSNDLKQQFDTIKDLKIKMEDEINDLKDMVEQGAAFESMVEDLSDRIMGMEDDNLALRATIRDLEEAAELTQEMEEVQMDELKALTQDMEGRDTIIRNLEEAIKMQRRREEDFLRTVANYRQTVATLREEKQALLELQQGGEGEKSDLIAATQNALSRAAQLVSDAAAIRKREAKAVVDTINYQTYHHLSVRIESILPQSSAPQVVAEVNAIKGELMASKVVSTASKTLEGIASSFNKAIRPALEADNTSSSTATISSLELSDEVQQRVVTMIHQAEFAHVVIGVSSDVLRLLFAGQWSDLLSDESSIELGSILSHTTESLDSSLAGVLKTLKEEGALTPEQSNIGALRQTIQASMQSLKTEIEHEDRMILPASWNPPGWELMKHATVAKFACQGAAAALSTVLHQSDSFVAPSELVAFYNRVEQASTQSKMVCLRLCNLDINNESLVADLSGLAKEWMDSSMVLLNSINEVLLSNKDAAAQEAAEASVGNVLPALAKLISTLRSANLSPSEKETYHALSPEVEDPWTGVASLSSTVRAIEGDAEDVHYLLRARTIEHRLDQAIENEPQLEIAKSKVASLEKSLASKMKEVSLQTARLSELEKLLAKSSASPIGGSKNKTSLDFRSSEEYRAIQEENRVLTEAMEVVQRQVDEYENEIRVLKDFKSPGKGPRNRTPITRRAITSVSDASPYLRGGVEEPNSNTSALEATLFRPALQKAIRDAAKWKAATMANAMLELPPLPSTKALGSVSEDLMELTSAQANYRLEKASITLVDLTRRDKTPRMQLRESNARVVAATERLQSVVRRCEGRAF